MNYQNFLKDVFDINMSESESAELAFNLCYLLRDRSAKLGGTAMEEVENAGNLIVELAIIHIEQNNRVGH